MWNRNVVALGLASGFLQPLESTSIHLIQAGICRLLELFPREGISTVLVQRYNDRLAFEFDRIRDFLVLHYHATERDDSAFWRNCHTMQITPELQFTLDLFRDSGRFYRNAEEMFAEISWVQVMVGQGILPQGDHPLVDQVPDHDAERFPWPASRRPSATAWTPCPPTSSSSIATARRLRRVERYTALDMGGNHRKRLSLWSPTFPTDPKACASG